MTKDEDIGVLRHSLSHLLAAAVLEVYPNALPTLGPAIENGFYYDFDFKDRKITDSELPVIEKKMRDILKTWDKFEGRETTQEEALILYKDNPYKKELINEIAGKGEKITLYTSGKFTDLCRGGHIKSAKNIKPDSFKLDKIAGAYWRGDEKNQMLTRIYGLAFNDKKELEDYIKQQEEAEKRDHRKLGKELKIFTFDDDVGPGLPLWLPNGAVIIEELEKLASETEFKAGYKRVRTPHIAKESMYIKSGHLPYYQESMYPPMECEGGRYYLRAMNCPHHHKIFASESRSYRDLPLRLAEYGTVYRNEKSGELFGLMRVRFLQMNDAHMYCTEEQFPSEFRAVNDMYINYFQIFGIKKYLMRFSTHDPKHLGQKYVDEPELWKKTEDMVRKTLIESKIPFVEVPNEAAFYGPKIDVQVWSAIGREFTLATNQVDFAQPRRFGLVYTDKDGKDKTPVCIHRAPLGTHERFIGFLIEHYAGAFPIWLSPVQVKVLSVGEKHREYVQMVVKSLMAENIRAELDNSDESVGKKVRGVKMQKIPYWIVIGDKEIENKNVSVESRDKGNIGSLKLEDFVSQIKEEINNRK
ncbi:MAG: threonine--tRNA ligase [Candidatus Zambryskibacteria bacterium RIFCSPHIGHO2_01_FULL_43_25]|uniref:Threonine--tRNA ligase n=1 Tax=Candidatus Zambryskibacteria bacterium RIFCSPLOWO2_01_FULL_45_21 TaxID=1802761 RepID=A0A1G2U3W3_9BACT|nr:MAG: threonine--tRNA ligase [Candidatus Zambryskibacteria bacterium RIFCSPHIGHO2_01_FULL_43_25]OHB00398.1 MAG: threonine--tRNA ligase [Candidatus Zambryskibacteria bacterium RIFCSPHIGHO2_12_FULL_44_12b]OHB04193.1 MAG: threonine--tRNA ligase [Candidatus Zambryskibacteria bacterium RIFCSPLOWO2_01_FULL_45_21]